jgi:hypothetical protein
MEFIIGVLCLAVIVLFGMLILLLNERDAAKDALLREERNVEYWQERSERYGEQRDIFAHNATRLEALRQYAHVRTIEANIAAGRARKVKA